MAEGVDIKQKITLYLQEAVTALQQETLDKDEPVGRWIVKKYIMSSFQVWWFGSILVQNNWKTALGNVSFTLFFSKTFILLFASAEALHTCFAFVKL